MTFEIIRRRTIRFALAMLFVGLAVGVYTRESFRPLEKLLDSTTLELVRGRDFVTHGHAILYGFALPLLLLGASALLKERFDEKAWRAVNKAFVLAAVGVVLTLALTLYKSSALVFALAANPAASLPAVDAGLFGGVRGLREALHTLAHALFGVGYVWWGAKLWKRA